MSFFKKRIFFIFLFPIALVILPIIINLLSLFFFQSILLYIPATDSEINTQTATNCSPKTLPSKITNLVRNNKYPAIPYPPTYDYKSSIVCFMNAYKTCKDGYLTPPSIPDTGNDTYITEKDLGMCVVKIIHYPGNINNAKTTKDYCLSASQQNNNLHFSLCTSLLPIDYPSN